MKNTNGQWALTTPKKKKTDLKVGWCLGTTAATAQGFPGTRGWLLHKIERKFRWSVGTDQQKKYEKMT